MGVTKGDVDLAPYLASLVAFHQAMADALAGHPTPLSWQLLLGGGLNDLAGKYKFVLVQPQQNFGALQPGGEATDGHARDHRRTAVREGGRRACPHHRSGGAGGRGIRHRRGRRGGRA